MVMFCFYKKRLLSIVESSVLILSKYIIISISHMHEWRLAYLVVDGDFSLPCGPSGPAVSYKITTLRLISYNCFASTLDFSLASSLSYKLTHLY